MTIICLASLLNLSSASFPGLVWAKDSNENDKLDIPDRRIGGGTRRGNCDGNFNEKPLTALIPENSLGITATASPKFFFYIPRTAQPQVVEFVLRDQNDKLVYITTFTVIGNSGMISLSLPASAKLNLLKINQDYHWYLSMICNPQNRAQDIVVEGLIRQVELDSTLAKKLDQATPMDRVRLYQEADLWHEALHTLVELQRSRPNDLTVSDTWIQLLQSVNLNVIAQESLIDSYSLIVYESPMSK
ncbi:MAG: DUF928 domain-containing protein [Xenococcaceae cyanobacterium]